uniref:Uncharacterized protein n=1 Tax=Heliothis virescens TaxID=7102 RepID=A0A2A4JYL2_HELVI
MTEVKITVGESYGEKRSIALYLRLIFHVIASGVFHSVLMFGGYLWMQLLQKDVTDPAVVTAKLFTPCYLTNWNFLFQTIFLTMSLVYDLMEWFDRHETSLGKKLRFCRDVMFSGLVVPLTLVSLPWSILESYEKV